MDQEAATTVLTNPKVATAVASATAGSGLANWFEWINSGLSLVAVCAGITLTTILIRKHLYEYRMMKQRDMEQRGRREGDNGKCVSDGKA